MHALSSSRRCHAVDPGTRDVLVDQFEIALMRGHRRVAMRKYLMLVACDFDMPLGSRRAGEALVSASSDQELHRIRSDVRAWADMLAGRPLGGRASPPEPARPRGDAWSMLVALAVRGQMAATIGSTVGAGKYASERLHQFATT